MCNTKGTTKIGFSGHFFGFLKLFFFRFVVAICILTGISHTSEKISRCYNQLP